MSLIDFAKNYEATLLPPVADSIIHKL